MCRWTTSIVCAMAVSFVLPAWTDDELPDESTPAITVGTWNIEWLGKPNMRSGVAHDVAQKPDDLAAYIDLSDVDILALEEIDDTEAGGEQEEAFRPLHGHDDGVGAGDGRRRGLKSE